MNLVHIFSSYPSSYQPYNKFLLKSLKDRGYTIQIFSLSASNNPINDVVYLLDEITMINKIRSVSYNFFNFLKYKRYSRSGWKAALYYFTRYSKLLNYKKNLFHIHHIQIIHGMFLDFLICFDLKYCLSVRGSDITISLINNNMQRDRIKNAFNYSHGIHSISEFLKSIVIDLGIHADKITMIPRLITSATILHKKRDNNKLNLLTVGRFHWIKGYNYILEALNQLKKRGILFNYTICGSNDLNIGNEEQYLNYLISLYELNDVVELLGFVDQTELAKQYNKTDIYICGSLNEGLNTSIIKALQFKKIVIAPNIGGIPEYISDKENGILFNAGESKDLYNCLLTVINTNWQPNSYLPESYLSNKAILDKYHKFYSSITKSTGIK